MPAPITPTMPSAHASTASDDGLSSSTFFQSVLSSEATDKANKSKIAATLAQAAIPLDTDWVRKFIFERNIASDIQVVSNPSPRRILMRTTIYGSGSDMSDSSKTVPHLLIPVTSGGDEVVGVVIYTQETKEKSVGYLGRFHMNVTTGALLMISQHLPTEEDEAVSFVNMIRAVGGEGPLGAEDAFVRAAKSHITYWPPVRGRVGSVVPLSGSGAVASKLKAVVDASLFRAREYDACIIEGRLLDRGQHVACGSCMEKATETASRGDALGISIAAQARHCTCHGILVSAGQSHDFNAAERNCVTSHSGSWDGESLCLAVGKYLQVMVFMLQNTGLLERLLVNLGALSTGTNV